MTADPAAVIAAALDRRFREKHGPRGGIDDIIQAAHVDVGKTAVKALTAAGLRVVPLAAVKHEPVGDTADCICGDRGIWR